MIGGRCLACMRRAWARPEWCTANLPPVIRSGGDDGARDSRWPRTSGPATSLYAWILDRYTTASWFMKRWVHACMRTWKCERTMLQPQDRTTCGHYWPCSRLVWMEGFGIHLNLYNLVEIWRQNSQFDPIPQLLPQDQLHPSTMKLTNFALIMKISPHNFSNTTLYK
jgi:hypothetical protein